MSAVLQAIVSYILIYRYAALFVVSFLSSLGVPLPAAASAVAAAAFASQGYLNVFWLVVVGALGNIVGDLTMYWLMRRYGKRFLLWVGLRRLAESPALRNVEGTVETYKTWVVIASRFQDQATTIVNIISGLGKMDIKRFALLVSVGDVLQITFYIAIGSVFADNWQSVYSAVGKLGWIIALVLAIAVTALSTRAIKRVLSSGSGGST
jgi:membrane protein DedA with SNARE-associated domain